MPAIVYPAGLPGPSVGWAAALRDRAARSSLQGNPRARRRSHEAMVDVDPATWLYSAAELAVWWPWFNTTLVDGQLWWQVNAPGPGGLVARVVRYRSDSVTFVPQGNGIGRVTAQLEVSGSRIAPQD